MSAQSFQTRAATKFREKSRWLSLAALGLILLLGAGLRLYQLGAAGDGNLYYAATVKSMLTSWHNFFYAAYEPGGSVSVDKPPLGFWIQAVFAAFLGVNGFALALPQALAGIASIYLVYRLVRNDFGTMPGLAAALVLAIAPITIATERNNTIDGTLIFFLLLAALAFQRAARSGRLGTLLVGGVLVGLAFNIKMLQAFMPLPAFYALYLLRAPRSLRTRLWHLTLTGLVILIVSFSWAVAVDLTPADQRPYVGSSTQNSVLELIFGHNGLRRLVSDKPGSGMAALPGGAPDFPQGFTPPEGAMVPEGFSPPAGGDRPPAGNYFPENGARPEDGGAMRVAGMVPFANQNGLPGALRLFTQPLGEEAGWLLPAALLALPVVLVALGRRWRLDQAFSGLILWGFWLLAETIYFSFTSGLMHAYYTIMLGPPLAALCGAGLWAVLRLRARSTWLAWGGLALLWSACALVQWTLLASYTGTYAWLTALLLAAGLTGLLLALLRPAALFRVGLALAALSLLAAPFTWSLAAALDPSPNTSLPSANRSQDGMDRGPGEQRAEINQAILGFLLEHTTPGAYLFATSSSQAASPYILATGRPVLALGGFSGSDPVLDVEGFANWVSAGKIRYVLNEFDRQQSQISQWVQTNCRAITIPGSESQSAPGGPGGSRSWYDCQPLQ